MKDIEFIILCKAKSIRNYPLSKGISHRALLPLGSKRVIDYIVKDIIDAGGTSITIVCPHERAAFDFKEALVKDEDSEDSLRYSGQTEIADNLKETFIPDNVNVRYVVEDGLKGTAHAIGLAHMISRKSHAAIIFPDDLYFCKGENQLKKIVEEFRTYENKILISGVETDDIISNIPILAHGNLIEGSSRTNALGCFSPMIFPKPLCDYLTELTERMDNGEALNEMSENGDLGYVRAINSFTNRPNSRYITELFLKTDEIEYMSTRSVPMYEKILLKSLLTLSKYKDDNMDYLDQILEEEDDLYE